MGGWRSLSLKPFDRMHIKQFNVHAVNITTLGARRRNVVSFFVPFLRERQV